MSSWGYRIISLFLLSFMIFPLLLLVLFSFTNSGMAAFPIESLTLHWWTDIFSDDQFRAAFLNSVIVGCSTAAISATVGTITALGLVQARRGTARVFLGVISLPLMLPPLVLGVSLLNFYVAIGLPLGLPAVILSHLLFTLPFVVFVVYARLLSFDFLMVESARDLGATPITAFVTVTFPAIAPSIIGAALLALALSIDDFVITFFTIGIGNTLPTFVWGMIRTSLTPAANAIGTLIIAISLVATILAVKLTGRNGSTQ
jgi:spermidine/putrescine transport system permease protein